jgi:sodium/bile acid cotransporter 7
MPPDAFRTALRCIAAALLCLAILPTACAAAGMSDAEKLAEIESLYSGYRKDFPDVEDIGPREAMELARSGKVVFVDVRTKKEQEVSMLPGAVTEEEFLSDPRKFAGLTPIGYCTISYRSGVLAGKLKARGIRMLNLHGGMLAWIHAGGKLYDRSGETRRIHVYGRKWNLGPSGYDPVW